MNDRTRARLVLAGGAVALAVAIGGAASAYWSGSGAGGGGGRTASSSPMTLTPGTPSATLKPGGRADVVLTASNPNPFEVHIGSLERDPGSGVAGFAVDAAHGGCAVSTLGYTSQTNGGSGWSIPARSGGTDGTLSITLQHALTMSLGAANACQGASITVYLAASS